MRPAAEKDDPQRELMKNSLRNAKTLVFNDFLIVLARIRKELSSSLDVLHVT